MKSVGTSAAVLKRSFIRNAIHFKNIYIESTKIKPKILSYKKLSKKIKTASRSAILFETIVYTREHRRTDDNKNIK